ncbi:MAG: hypothetical protein DIU80_001835 [Chloroflexota bacterium]|nr:MAG: hypothetical protein DIU80_10805 [Chloroflexota bacterium]
MNGTTGASYQPLAVHPAPDAPYASAAPAPQQQDYVRVPRCILERLLAHSNAAYRRFPTRHLLQIIRILQHLLNADS